MSKLVATNIRLPAKDLNKYRMIALSENKSFSSFVKEVLEKFTSIYTITGEKTIRKEVLKEPGIFNLAKYKKWASGHKHDAKKHDNIIYGA